MDYKINDIRFYENDKSNISIDEISGFIKDIDNHLLDPIYKRDYFESYKKLAVNFYNIGNIIYCRNDNILIGLDVFYADNKKYSYAYQTFIGVLNEYNGLGIAKELMMRESKLAKNLGMKGIMTNCHRNNKKKIQLNINVGFKEIENSNEIESYLQLNHKWKGKIFFKKEF